MNEMANSNYCSGGYRPTDPLPFFSQTIKSFACKVHNISITHYVPHLKSEAKFEEIRCLGSFEHIETVRSHSLFQQIHRKVITPNE